jgi:AAA+ ATPase superfamily predicted ATPase
MVTVMTVPRQETLKMKNIRGWTLLYGRRKVGKTFLVRHFLTYDLYVLVKRGGGALFENAPLKRTDNYDQVIEIITNALDKNSTVVVDEFQRLPDDFLDTMQMHHPKGTLLLLGSSFHVAKELTSRHSPLLGLLAEVPLSLISPQDIFTALSTTLPPEHALMLSPYLRDPWALQYLQKHPVQTLSRILEYSKNAIPALLGEIFLDEDRYLSEVYESILRSIAGGKNTLHEVSDQLFSRKLIKGNNPSLVRPYVKNMEDMDLIHRIPLFDRPGYYYMVKSKLMELYYYLDEKYGMERQQPDLVQEVIQERLPFHVQFFLGELLADYHQGTFRYFMSKDYDIDIIITKRNRPVFIGEVKWSKHVSHADISRFLRNTERFTCPKAILSRVPVDTTEVKIITPNELLKMIQQSKKENNYE